MKDERKNPALKSVLQFFIILSAFLFVFEVFIRISSLSKGRAESPVMFVMIGIGAIAVHIITISFVNSKEE